MQTDDNRDDLMFEDVKTPGVPLRRIGKLKRTGVIVLESKFDEHQREVEKCFFDDDGRLRKRIVYEYDENRKPLLITVFDQHGRLVMRQERGKAPEFFA